MRRLAAVLALALAAAPLAAQTAGGSARVAAGPEYRAGALKRALMGRSYRELWTAPVNVPVLDLATFAGGLTPTETGGGNQTLSLRFRAADGREFAFRSVNKDPGRGEGGRGGIAGAALRDQVSSQNPAGALVAGRLMDATGALHVDPLLFVMPDDPRLGEFRAQFAGMLGQLEERPGDGFAGAADVEGTEDFLRALEADPANRLAAEEYLAVRLMDVLLNDWDRHEDQYQWARFDRGGVRWWRPVPRDRDYVFVDYDGVLLDLARPLLPKAVRFRPGYRGTLFGLVQQGQYLDRRLLGGLDRAAWDSVAAALRARLTDALIDEAVALLPAEYRALEGPRLAATLRARRDRLPAAAAELYGWFAREPEVYATDRADLAVVERLGGGGVELRIHPGTDASAAPYFRRRFVPGETREVRVFLYGGDDRAEVRGSGGMLVRVMGGRGDDQLEDRGTGRTAFYDQDGANRFVRGRNTVVDERAYGRAEYLSGENDASPARDWGTSGGVLSPFATLRPFADLVVGVGPSYTRYGFRRAPFAERWHARALWAPLDTRFGAEARYTRMWTGGRSFGTVFARASELEAVRFPGFGNNTPPPDDERGGGVVWERQALLEPGIVLSRGGGLSLGVAGVLRYTDPQVEPLTPAEAYGAAGTAAYLAAGVRAGAAWVRTDTAAALGRGWTFAVEGAAFPLMGETGDQPVAESVGAQHAGHAQEAGAFARARAVGTAYLPLGPVVLAVRAGGERAWGGFPIQYAARLGGSPTLRGYAYQRFAGDQSAFGGVELRSPLFGPVGVLALADAGRVWYDGRSDGGWHTSLGAGAFLRVGARTASLSYAYGEHGIVYLRLGLPF